MVCCCSVDGQFNPRVSVCLPFQCLSPSPLWLNRPVFLPHWNYIPHNASGQDLDETGGHVELIGSPVLLCPAPEQGLVACLGGGAELAVGVREAARLLHSRLTSHLTFDLLGVKTL